MPRCSWADATPAMTVYHDTEWGQPCHDDRALFELLILEGAQAGLSWRTVLDRRAGYRRAFAGFDPAVVAGYDQQRQEELLTDPGIVRNRAKVRSAVANAAAFLSVAAEAGSFDGYLWAWVDGEPQVHRPSAGAEVAARSELSDRLSADLRRRGFSFVGSTIVYAYLQATGVIDDHLAGCTLTPRSTAASPPTPARAATARRTPSRRPR